MVLAALFYARVMRVPLGKWPQYSDDLLIQMFGTDNKTFCSLSLQQL